VGKKGEILTKIRGARREHVAWVERAKALVNGLDISKEQIPVKVTNCEFGKWFYCDGQILLSIFKEEAVEKIENRHKELHSIYMKIFKIYFDRAELSLLAKIFRRKQKVSAHNEYSALEHLEDLEKISTELISYLNIIEKKISNIDDDKLERLK